MLYSPLLWLLLMCHEPNVGFYPSVQAARSARPGKIKGFRMASPEAEFDSCDVVSAAMQNHIMTATAPRMMDTMDTVIDARTTATLALL